MRALTPNFKRNINAVTSTQELPVVLLEITSPLLTTPVYICNSDCNVVSNSNEYIAFPFEFILPEDSETAQPKARIRISNIDRELVRWIDLSKGGRGSIVTYSIIESDNPDYIEFSSVAQIESATMNNEEITLSISYDYILGRDVLPQKYNKKNAEGLF